VILDVGQERRAGTLAVNEVGDRGRNFARRIGHEGSIVRIGRGWDALAEAGAVPDLTRVALAGSHRRAAVVRRRVPKHVEEQAVHLVSFERLRENRQRVLTVVVAVDAGGIQAVVDGRLAAGALEEPLRMRVERRLLRFAQVEAPDHANAACVRLTHDLAEEIATGRQERARVMERHARRILRDDAAHVHEKRVRAEVGDGSDKFFGIDDRIGFAQVGLQETDWFAHPPSRAGYRRWWLAV
jgi:hypothetical protein